MTEQGTGIAPSSRPAGNSRVSSATNDEQIVREALYEAYLPSDHPALAALGRYTARLAAAEQEAWEYAAMYREQSATRAAEYEARIAAEERAESLAARLAETQEALVRAQRWGEDQAEKFRAETLLSNRLARALVDAATVIERMANGASRAECSPELDRVLAALSAAWAAERAGAAP